jgi:hypothetical protein
LFDSSQLDLLDANAREVQERDTKSRNIVIFGIKPSPSEEAQERKTFDTEAVASILTELNITTQVVAVRRFRGGASAQQIGPIQVVLTSTDERNKILKSASKLRANADRAGVYINPDETPAQQKHSKFLRQECDRLNKEKLASAEKDQPFRWAIRSGRVARVNGKWDSTTRNTTPA